MLISRIFDWFLFGFLFGDWRFPPDVWKANEKNLGMKIPRRR